ncbi:MAG: hypothetical protein B7Z80_04955 [Rhodospirillales bacterium 20-64-7]|nr:MAG: hypothetical protein B7Z80_04955 [Rhodospirillales bacterium 20-64-7]
MTTRRNLLACAAGLVPLSAASAMAAPTTADPTSAPGNVRSAGSILPVTGSPIDKSQVGYQSVPRNGKVCAQCVYFIFKPSEGGTPQSRCKMVAGTINPAGWCEIWQPQAAG